ncbi:MAG: thioredoxin fold domain-containing protein [Thiogranum sp.]
MQHGRSKSGAAALALVAVLAAPDAGAEGIRPAGDLHSDARAAQRDCKPLLLEFAATYCDYCHLLEREILNPTLLNRDYDSRVLMRKLLIDRSAPLVDFNGTDSVTAGQLAERYQVSVTPTLLFVDGSGEELSGRMVGVTTLDFYGGYLDLALDRARARLRNRLHCREGKRARRSLRRRP